MDSEKMTISKRLVALGRAIGYLGGNLLLVLNPPEHNASITGFENDDVRRMKANFAYFLGNSAPLEEIRQADAESDIKRKGKKKKKD